MSDQDERTDAAGQGDRRVQRTRAALRAAFNQLILARGYDAISAADIAAHADVGRSTFYEHDRSKEDILTQSLVPVLTPLAETCADSPPDPRLTAALDHFWDNRKLARALMGGRAHGVTARMLGRLIEDRLKAGKTVLPAAMVGACIAHSQLSLIEEWLTGRHGCSAGELAAALHDTTRAMIAALTKR